MKSFLGVLALLSLVVACPLAAQPLDGGGPNAVGEIYEWLATTVESAFEGVAAFLDSEIGPPIEPDGGDTDLGLATDPDSESELGGLIEPEG